MPHRGITNTRKVDGVDLSVLHNCRRPRHIAVECREDVGWQSVSRPRSRMRSLALNLLVLFSASFVPRLHGGSDCIIRVGAMRMARNGRYADGETWAARVDAESAKRVLLKARNTHGKIHACGAP